jgi:lysophospholipase L1-like esterase
VSSFTYFFLVFGASGRKNPAMVAYLSLAGLAAATITVVAILLLYVKRCGTAPPANAPATYLRALTQQRAAASSASEPPLPPPRVVALLGDSITHGRGSSDYAAMLQDLLSQHGPGDGREIKVVNAGVNGEVVWSMRRRLGEVLACDPNVLILMAGTNDWKGIYNATWGASSCARQNLPVQRLTAEYFASNLAGLIDDARAALPSSATILVCELPPMGEDLDAPCNADHVRRANAVIRRLVGERSGGAQGRSKKGGKGGAKVALVSTHEALVKHLAAVAAPRPPRAAADAAAAAAAAAGRGRPATATLMVGGRAIPQWADDDDDDDANTNNYGRANGNANSTGGLMGPEPFDRWNLPDGTGGGDGRPRTWTDRALASLPRYQACVVRRYLFLEDWDSIGRRYGYRILTDGLHLNDTGGAIVAKTIAAAIRREGWSPLQH